MCEQLGDEAALADAGDAHERHLLRRPFLPGSFEPSHELIELSPAADERRACRHRFAAHPRARSDGLPDAYRLGLPFRVDGLGFAVVDHVPGRAVRRLADEDSVHGRRGLQPCRRVHHVPRRHSLTL